MQLRCKEASLFYPPAHPNYRAGCIVPRYTFNSRRRDLT